jgi:hypothetical protein
MSVFARSVTPCAAPVVPSLAKTTFGNLRIFKRPKMGNIRALIVLNIPTDPRVNVMVDSTGSPNQAMLNCPHGIFCFKKPDEVELLISEIGLMEKATFDRSFSQTVLARYNRHETHYIAAFCAIKQDPPVWEIWCQPKAGYTEEEADMYITDMAKSREPLVLPKPNPQPAPKRNAYNEYIHPSYAEIEKIRKNFKAEATKPVAKPKPKAPPAPKAPPKTELDLPVRIIRCITCDFHATDFVVHGNLFYELSDGCRIMVCQRLGWCSRCGTIVGVENLIAHVTPSHFRAAEDMIFVLEREQAEAVKALESNLPLSEERIQQLTKYVAHLRSYCSQLHESHRHEERVKRFLDERTDLPRCLTCSSTEIIYCNFRGGEKGTAPSRTGFFHPGCGGEFTVEYGGTKMFNTKRPIRVYDPTGRFVREELAETSGPS